MGSAYEVCAHATPQFSPYEDEDGRLCYPVKPTCIYATWDCTRSREGERVLTESQRLHKCTRRCRRFTDSTLEQLIIRNQTFRASLYIDRLADLPVVNLRKLLTLMLTEHWTNGAAIDHCNTYFPDKVASTKAGWDQASRAFQAGYRLVNRYDLRRHLQDAVERDRENKRLQQEVKAAKTTYERWQKVLTIWNTLKTKYDID